MFRKRVIVHECVADKPGHVRWTADWRMPGGRQGASVEALEGDGDTHAALLNWLPDIVGKRYRIVYRKGCGYFCD